MMFFIKIFKIGIYLSLIGLTVLIITGFSLLWKYSPDLPSYSELKDYNPSLSTRVFTSDGRLLDKYFIEERLFVPIDKIPPKLIKAFLSAEDKNFFNHSGIDLIAILRASITNLYNFFSNKRLIGASTITQQVVKNLLLSNEVSFERKIKEMILAIRLEIVLEKNKILELYLNDIYLGYGSYGVAAASLNYFDKSLQELDLQEMAFLAALPKAPNNYHPIKNYQNAISRRNWVLEQMYSNGHIKKSDLIIKNEELLVKKRSRINPVKASYFREEVRKELNKIFGSKKLYNEGLIVKTTIDTDLQKIADKVLIDGLINYDQRMGWRGVIGNNQNFEDFKNPFPENWFLAKIESLDKDNLIILLENDERNIVSLTKKNKWLSKEDFLIGDIIFIEKNQNELVIQQIPKVNGAILVMDPHNGKVLALSGGFSFNLSEFNRATQALRQPGSAFKPFVYMSALNEGYTPSTLILDAPYVVDQGPGLPKWKPSNYTEEFYGLSTMRLGIEKSRNLMTIRLADRIGMKKILEKAKLFNIHHHLNDNLSMALGAGEVTLKNLTNAYAMIVNGGKKINPKLIESVNDKRGKIILSNEQKKCLNCKQIGDSLNFQLPLIENNEISVVDEKIAYQMVSILEGVVLRGTGKKISSLDVPLAGKTGTTNKNKDAWFIGFSPDIVVGVYVGHDNPVSLGYKQTGSNVAAPIFKNFMDEAKINKNKIPFRIPSGISFVNINTQTGLQTNSKDGILEPFIVGTEPFNKSITILDSLGSVRKDTLSGTGNLIID